MGENRIWVEAWSPEYGASYEAALGLAQSEEEVAPNVEVEMTKWERISPPDGPTPPMAFVDGVSRIDARAFLQKDELTIPGLCGSVGVGAVFMNGNAEFGPSTVRRSVVFGHGEKGSLPPIRGALHYESRAVAGTRPEDLGEGLRHFMADAEEKLAATLAGQGWVVIADGPAAVREKLDIVGMIKSHYRSYLPPELQPIVSALEVGQRTPIFMFGIIRPRYSWYVRLADTNGGHPWSAIVRCEAYAAIDQSRAVELADLTARVLPAHASKPYWDPRAPQNLVPIATLERKLRHLLGDREVVYRRIRSALMREPS